ncbi:MAG: T9SS type A sorting domain-containing protein [Candidatus Electryonea clarkiae]|nr:T9SS type A sorting domain-containing protein [Candidatus Electryonea clarkiae]MDP8285477.1 T9SS type A sorting domain-containing protein [Candidatus Electryonea clarkiae]
MKSIILAIPIIFMSCNFSIAQDSLNISLLEKVCMSWRPVCDFEFYGDTAIVATSGTGLRFVDMSDPEKPVDKGGFVPEWEVVAVTIHDSIAYVVARKLYVLDISDLLNPVVIGRSTFNVGGGASYCSIEVQGGWAYISHQDMAITKIQISNPERIRRFDNYPIPGCRPLFSVTDSSLFIVTDEQNGQGFLRIYTAPDMEFVTSYELPGPGTCVTESDNKAYVTYCSAEDDPGGLLILDVEEPANPTELGRYEVTDSAFAVVVDTNVAYLLGNDTTLYVLNVEDPANPEFLSIYTVPRNTIIYKILAVNEDLLITGKWPRDYIVMFDVSDPEDPDDIDGFPQKYGWAHHISPSYYNIFITTRDAFKVLSPFDLQNGRNWRFTCERGYIGIVRKMQVCAHYAFVLTDDRFYPFRLLDVSQPDTVRWLRDSLDFRGNDFVIDDWKMYIAGTNRFLTIVDVSNPEDSEYLDSLEISFSIGKVEVSDSIAILLRKYGTNYENNIAFVDVSDPANPSLLAEYDLPIEDTVVVVDKNILFARIERTDTLLVYDFSDPEDLRLISSTQQGYYSSLSVDDNYLVGTWRYGLNIIDITDLEQPQIIGYYEQEYNYLGKATSVFGNRLLDYVGSFINIFEHDLPAPPTPFSLTNPKHNRVFTPNEITNLFLSWQKSVNLDSIEQTVRYDINFHATSDDFFDTTLTYSEIIDTSIRINLQESLDLGDSLNSLNVVWWVEAIAEGDTVRCNDKFYFTVQPINDLQKDKSDKLPVKFDLETAYPNPFNETASIRYALPERANIKLAVFDILGREVVRLEDGYMEAGWHQTVFDAKVSSSGIYFVQATVPGKMNEVRKIVLIK